MTGDWETFVDVWADEWYTEIDPPLLARKEMLQKKWVSQLTNLNMDGKLGKNIISKLNLFDNFPMAM